MLDRAAHRADQRRIDRRIYVDSARDSAHTRSVAG
jgi:hypothetical protein